LISPLAYQKGTSAQDEEVFVGIPSEMYLDIAERMGDIRANCYAVPDGVFIRLCSLHTQGGTMPIHARIRFGMLQLVTLLTSIVLSGINSGCASSQLADMWRDPEYNSPPMKSVLIIASKKAAVNRRLWEDEFSAALAAQHVTAVCSYRLFPDSIPTPPEVGSIVQERKFDGVLFVRRLPPRILTMDVPGSMKAVEVTRYNPRTQSYSTFFHDERQPSHADTNIVYRHEVLLFTAQDEGGRLIWSGTGELIYPDSRAQIRHDITSLIVPELGRQGIIPKE
jgi:hypothetical protein